MLNYLHKTLHISFFTGNAKIERNNLSCKIYLTCLQILPINKVTSQTFYVLNILDYTPHSFCPVYFFKSTLPSMNRYFIYNLTTCKSGSYFCIFKTMPCLLEIFPGLLEQSEHLNKYIHKRDCGQV